MKTETKVGFFVVVGLSILLIGILWKSNLVLRAGGYNVIGQFKTVSGLLAGGEVRYRGYVVGTVSSVLPGPKMVEVTMYIQDGVNIPEGSRFRIDFDGLIGEKFVNVIPNVEGRRSIVAGEVLQGTAAQGLVDFID
ncbi:MAG: MlaD family protein, partial [Candidatus Margulisiibacteriota bacterium]